ncbi:MAG TPA: hypothetical protein VF627_01625, partial [Abditibacterium sp.]
MALKLVGYSRALSVKFSACPVVSALFREFPRRVQPGFNSAYFWRLEQHFLIQIRAAWKWTSVPPRDQVR